MQSYPWRLSQNPTITVYFHNTFFFYPFDKKNSGDLHENKLSYKVLSASESIL